MNRTFPSIQVPRDWTLLPYGLYGLVPYLLASIDFDESPHLDLWDLLPVFPSLCAAQAHLHIRSTPLRIAAFLAGVFARLFLPLAYGMVLSAILLSPLLVTRAIQSWRTALAAR